MSDENLELGINIGHSVKPKVPKPPKLDKRVDSITTAGLIKWLQFVDPTGKLKIDVGFSDCVSVVKPDRGKRGSAEVIATLDVEGF